MQIAVCGGGLAGVSLAYHLLRDPRVSITLFDPLGIGGGASGVAAGLLHPNPGRHARKSWRADEGLAETIRLLEVAERILNREVALKTGILRLAITEEQVRDFSKVAGVWMESDRTQELCPLATLAPGVWIPEGVTVFMRLYLEGLWRACEERGATLVRTPLEGSFDRVVLATGASLVDRVPLSVTKGQLLVCRRPSSIPPLTLSLASNGHISPTEDPDLWHLGSTYEHTADPTPNPETALSLLERVSAFYPPARELEVVEVRAGLRVTQKGNYHPFVGQIDKSVWAFVGLGSRGLLYHALLGRELATQILQGI